MTMPEPSPEAELDDWLYTTIPTLLGETLAYTSADVSALPVFEVVVAFGVSVILSSASPSDVSVIEVPLPAPPELPLFAKTVTIAETATTAASMAAKIATPFFFALIFFFFFSGCG